MKELQTVREAVLAEAKRPSAYRPGFFSGPWFFNGPWFFDVFRLLALHGMIACVSLVTGSFLFASHVQARWQSGIIIAATIAAGVHVAVSPNTRVSPYGYLLLCVVASLGAVFFSHGHEHPTWALMDAGCAAAELGISVVPIAASLCVLKRFAYHPMRALTGGLAAGATGLLVLNLSCPVDGPAHALAFHIAPWLIVACATVAIRSRLRSTSFVP